MRIMFELVLISLSIVHVECEVLLLLEQAIPILLQQVKQKFFKERPKDCPNYTGEDIISALPDHLIVQILLLIPTKDAVTTMILSKRWHCLWTMVPKLKYLEITDDTRGIVFAGLLGRLFGRLFGKRDQKQRCIWRFLNESLKLHKAPILEHIMIQLGRQCPVDADFGKLIVNAVDIHKVRKLEFMLSWSAEPARLPSNLYSCSTLVSLSLSNKILMDVPSSACLPSLKFLGLYYLVYRDDDSLVRLLSSCHILKYLAVYRHYQDNVTNFNIKVPSLECLFYEYTDNDRIGGTLHIDSSALKKVFIKDYSEDSCSVENKPRFDKAIVYVACYPGNNFLRSLSSVTYLQLSLSFATVACCNAIKFSQLMECIITLVNELDWLEPLVCLLQNCPNLKVAYIDQTFIPFEEDLPLSWNQPSCVPECLSSHLEIFEWKGYRGNREKELVRYVLANSTCLKRAGISIDCRRIFRKRMRRELESMPRVSTSSQLLFSTQLEYLNVENEMKID